MRDVDQTAYEEGRSARKSGRAPIPDGNPYRDEDGTRAWWWNFGWHMADADEYERRQHR